jgi:hypothetical protein
MLLNALLWALATTVAVARRLTPLAIFIAKELLSPRPRLLAPAAAQPLTPPAPAPELALLTRRQLQDLVGTRRNLPKAVLLEMAAHRPLAQS